MVALSSTVYLPTSERFGALTENTLVAELYVKIELGEVTKTGYDIASVNINTQEFGA